MILTAAYAVLILALKFNRQVDDSVTNYQQSLTAVSRMSRSLSAGAQGSLLIEAEGFSFITADPISGPFTHNSSGLLEWQNYQFFYVANSELFAGIVEMTPTVTLPVNPGLAALRADSSARIAKVAEGVESLTVTGGSGASIVVRLKGKQEATNSLTVQSRISFRND